VISRVTANTAYGVVNAGVCGYNYLDYMNRYYSNPSTTWLHYVIKRAYFILRAIGTVSTWVSVEVNIIL